MVSKADMTVRPGTQAESVERQSGGSVHETLSAGIDGNP